MVEKPTASTVKITKLKEEVEEDQQEISTRAIGFVIPEEEKEEYYEDDE